MEPKPSIFCDSSALLDALFAMDDSPYFDLFDLGEAGTFDLRVSPDVIRECENILRKRGDDLVPLLAIALFEANFGIVSTPNEETVNYCEQLTGYRSDARVLAGAEECLADIFVTHDKTHFLGNPLLGPPDTHCRVKTAQETLDWLLERLIADATRQ